MKKILSILFAFLGLGFLACIIIGFCKKPGVDLLAGAVTSYKFCTGLNLFTKILPCMVFAGFILATSIQFGRNPEGSTTRFSPAMFKRYKVIIIISIICTFILTLSNETLSLYSKRRQEFLRNQPDLVNEYIEASRNFLIKNNPEAAAAYAEEALKLDKTNEEAANLKNKADIQLNIKETKSVRILHETDLSDLFTDTSSNIVTESLGNVYNLYTKAKKAWANEEWFQAHYFAENAIKIASPKDANINELKEISAAAWNKLSELKNLARSEDQKVFMEKYEGYKALMEEDYLKAYYLLKTIQMEHPELKNDSDLNFYTDIAENKINERTFFSDETWNLKNFETANDIYFTLKHKDGWTDIIYFKGMTEVKTTGGMIQYLRGLSIQSIDALGRFHSSMSVPYAKVLTVSVKDLNPLIKDNLGLERSINYVPYILLRSIDRYNANESIHPLYSYADSNETTGSDFTMLPMEFSDFQMIEKTTANPETIPLGTLFRLISKAESFGYSPSIFGQVLLNRLLYPLFILICFLILASFAWNYRMDENMYFKAVWILIFPIFAVLCQFFYQIITYLYKLFNYGLLGIFGPTGALLWGAVIFVIIVFITSIAFMGERSE